MQSCHSRPTPPISRPGLTLIELLVVIALIAILVSILIPVSSKFREASVKTVTVNRIRECARIIHLYAQDNHGVFPAPGNTSAQRWIHYIAPYVGAYEYRYDSQGILNGVSGKGNLYAEPILRDPTHQPSGGAGVFGYNAQLNRINSGGEIINDSGVPLTQISNPGRFPLLATSDAAAGGGLELKGSTPSPRALEQGWKGSTYKFGPAPLFGPYAVFAFADSHVELINVCEADRWPWNDPDAYKVR